MSWKEDNEIVFGKQIEIRKFIDSGYLKRIKHLSLLCIYME